MYAEYKETELKAVKTYSTSFNSYKFKPRAKYEQEDGWLHLHICWHSLAAVVWQEGSPFSQKY